MTAYNFENLNQLWQNLIADLLPRLQSSAFLIQLAAIAGAALLAVWLAPRLIRLLQRLLISGISRPWVQGISNVLASISVPGLWMFFLWLSVETGRSVGLPMTLARDAVSLLVAWVVIRLLSHVVRHPLWSSVIFFAAWSIAALDILGVLGQLEASLAAMVFPYGNARISALNVVRALVVLGVLLWLAALLRGFIEKRIFHAASLTPSLQALAVQLLKLIFPALAILASGSKIR